MQGSILRNAMYNYDNKNGKYGNFPDPFASYSKKLSKSADILLKNDNVQSRL